MGPGEPNDKSLSIARMMSLFLGITLFLRLVTDVLSDSYLKNSVFENADPRSDSYRETAARWSEALIVLSVVRKASELQGDHGGPPLHFDANQILVIKS